MWPVWRLVLARKATLHEIETHWSLTDLLDAGDALDVEEALEAEIARVQEAARQG